ncbi:putative transcriptional regulator [Streptomyces viridochromogenes Tue57]|uniref:Putative transcriptional regulator n=1 Tax=Streptomyces viridochromogenes Tue57 TaxID=1160705 RepID=L8PP07_STRVR|nr:putative transcriptional regulator [Streptomyces viridochromogenes Tue57]
MLERVEQAIAAGKLRVGDKLPAERELANMLGVSRASIREAVRILEAQGVITSQVGNGPGSGTVITAMSSDALTRILRLHVALARFPFTDLVEARITLERSSVALAAHHATDQQHDRLAGLLSAMDDPTVTPEMFNDLDTEFHVAIAEASGNQLVCDLTVAIRNSLRAPLLTALQQVADWGALAVTLRAEHRELFNAVRRGESSRAADLVEAHIRASYQSLLQDMEETRT